MYYVAHDDNYPAAHRHSSCGVPVLDDCCDGSSATSARTASGFRSPSTAASGPFIGWQLLMYVSVITIIGWAWVITAWMRWICRNISGTRREVVFNGTGLEVLWRTLLFVIGCVFIIPDSVGDALVHSLVRLAIRAGRTDTANARSRQRAHLRWRSEPSCATEATSVPSCLKIMPRVRPRPPCALGESWA